MLRFRDASRRPIPPHWLRGAADLAHGVGPEGDLWGIGHPAMMGNDGPWSEVGDGYEVAGQVDPSEIARSHLWASTVACFDRTGTIWQAPQILTDGGQRAFRVAYGRDWMPALSPDQARAEAIAREVRGLLDAGTDFPMQNACQWAAELLAMTYHLTPDVIGVMQSLDDLLVVQVITVAAGRAEVASG